MAVSGLKTNDFVTHTSKGIFVVKINFNANFWETVVATAYKFYCNQIVLRSFWRLFIVSIITQNSDPKVI